MTWPTQCMRKGCERDSTHRPNDNRDLCTQHYAQEYVPVSFFFGRDLPDWVEERFTSQEFLGKLIANYSPYRPHLKHVTVFFFSRTESETVAWKLRWEAYWTPDAVARKPYSYRGWCSGNQIVILVDPNGIDTPDGIEWVFWHELGHASVSQQPLIDNTFTREDSAAGREEYHWEDDVKHEAHAEEAFVNRIADSLTGGQYNRLWWRKRVNAYLATGNPEPVEVEAGVSSLESLPSPSGSLATGTAP